MWLNLWLVHDYGAESKHLELFTLGFALKNDFREFSLFQLIWWEGCSDIGDKSKKQQYNARVELNFLFFFHKTWKFVEVARGKSKNKTK